MTTLHTSEEHLSSYHLMYFQGTQDKHYHPGPRLLNIFASKPWNLYAGGANLSVLNRKESNKFLRPLISFWLDQLLFY